MANMSEDALFKALLKNKPAQQPQKPVAAQVSMNAPKREVAVPFQAPQPVEKYQIEIPVEVKPVHVEKPVNLEPVVDSIVQLNSNVNLAIGTMKNIITPILVLILVVLVGILVRTQ